MAMAAKPTKTNTTITPAGSISENCRDYSRKTAVTKKSIEEQVALYLLVCDIFYAPLKKMLGPIGSASQQIKNTGLSIMQVFRGQHPNSMRDISPRVINDFYFSNSGNIMIISKRRIDKYA